MGTEIKSIDMKGALNQSLEPITINWEIERLFAKYPNAIFFCSKCFKEYYDPNSCKKHFGKCSVFNSYNGIHIFDNSSNRIEKELVNELARLSKREQIIDFQMTDLENNKLGQQVYVLFDLGEPKGFLTISKRNFSCGEKYSIDDFFVIAHFRKHGCGKKLLKEFIKNNNISNETALGICRPSISCKNLLTTYKIKLGLEKTEFILWN